MTEEKQCSAGQLVIKRIEKNVVHGMYGIKISYTAI